MKLYCLNSAFKHWTCAELLREMRLWKEIFFPDLCICFVWIGFVWFGKGKNRILGFGYIKFEMHIKKPRRDVGNWKYSSEI